MNLADFNKAIKVAKIVHDKNLQIRRSYLAL